MMIGEFLKQNCVPVSSAEEALDDDQVTELKAYIHGWAIVEVDDVPHLRRAFEFEDFHP